MVELILGVGYSVAAMIMSSQIKFILWTRNKFLCRLYISWWGLYGDHFSATRNKFLKNHWLARVILGEVLAFNISKTEEIASFLILGLSVIYVGILL